MMIIMQTITVYTDTDTDYIVLLYSEKHAYPSNESVDSATICVSKLILCTTTCFRTEVMAQHS